MSIDIYNKPGIDNAGCDFTPKAIHFTYQGTCWGLFDMWLGDNDVTYLVLIEKENADADSKGIHK